MLALLLLLNALVPLQEPASAADSSPRVSTDAKPAGDFKPGPGWKTLGKDVWFDPKARQVIVGTKVSLRDGFLEHLLCIRQTKEHESILSTEAPPRMIHAGLLLTGAEVGQTVQFVPEFEPPKGTPLLIEAVWTDAQGRPQRIDVRQWVRESDTTATLKPHWVFAGSRLYPHPETGEMIYAAESGDLITVANFMSAIVDVPFASTADDSARSYVANTELIPPLGTPVMLLLKPVPAADAVTAPAAIEPPATSP